MVQIAQRGAGDVYGIAERVLTAAGLEGVPSLREAPGSSDAASTEGAGDDRN